MDVRRAALAGGDPLTIRLLNGPGSTGISDLARETEQGLHPGKTTHGCEDGEPPTGGGPTRHSGVGRSLQISQLVLPRSASTPSEPYRSTVTCSPPKAGRLRITLQKVTPEHVHHPRAFWALKSGVSRLKFGALSPA